MTLHEITRADPRYPPSLDRCLGEKAPACLTALGNLDILQNWLLAFLSSVKCPGRVVSAAYDFAQQARAQGRTVIGGFHSPMEKECLRILLCSPHPVVICLARSLTKLRVPREWQRPLTENRLLVLSPFAATARRATADLAWQRNQCVAALADEIVIAHVSPGGQMERLAWQVTAWGKPFRRLDRDL